MAVACPVMVYVCSKFVTSKVVYKLNCGSKYRLHGRLKAQLQGRLRSCEKCVQVLLCQYVSICHRGSIRLIFLKLGIGDFHDNLLSNCKLA